MKKIIVTRHRFAGEAPTVLAHVEGDTRTFGTGKTLASAVGELVVGHPERFAVEIDNRIHDWRDHARYADDKGAVVEVVPGLDGWYIASRRSASGCARRIKSRALPPRRYPAEAQADLDAYAERKGWNAVHDTP